MSDNRLKSENEITKNVGSRQDTLFVECGVDKVLDGISLDELTKKRIAGNCMKRKHVDNKVFLYSKQIAAAIVIGVLSTTTLTTYAAVSAYQAYMEKMSREEVEERYNDIQEGTKNADSFSRALTKEEQERMEDLRDAYWEGLLFPEQSMPVFDGTAEDAESAISLNTTGETAYDHINMIFYIPDKELTDEELLQIIDVWEKGNYSLGVINREQGLVQDAQSGGVEGTEAVNGAEIVNGTGEAGSGTEGLTDEELLAQAEAEMEKHKHAVPMTDEEKLQAAAEQTIEAITGNRPSDMTWEIVFYGEYNAKYWVTAESEKEKFSIFFTTDSTPDAWCIDTYMHWGRSGAGSGDSSTTEGDDLSGETENTGFAKEELEQEIKKFAEYTVTELPEDLGFKSQVVKCEYGYDNEVLTGESNRIMLCVSLESKDRYRFECDIQNSEICEVLLYEAGEYDDVDFSTWTDVFGEFTLD